VKRDLVIKGFDRKNVKYEEGLRVWETPLETGAEKRMLRRMRDFSIHTGHKKALWVFFIIKIVNPHKKRSFLGASRGSRGLQRLHKRGNGYTVHC
jgi:hypothetical protein